MVREDAKKKKRKKKGAMSSKILPIVPGVAGLHIIVVHTPAGTDTWTEKARAPENLEKLLQEFPATEKYLNRHHLVMRHPKRKTTTTFPSQLQTAEEYFPGRCLLTGENRVPPNPRLSFR